MARVLVFRLCFGVALSLFLALAVLVLFHPYRSLDDDRLAVPFTLLGLAAGFGAAPLLCFASAACVADLPAAARSGMILLGGGTLLFAVATAWSVRAWLF